MTIMAEIKGFKGILKAIFEDLHAHPEIEFDETRTAGIVAFVGPSALHVARCA